ncbi:MAG: nuclear transport factor 2 family protein [Kordiimonas sp.]
MKRILVLISLVGFSLSAHAQLEVTVHPDQKTLLESSDPILRANKKLVYDFWVKVFQGQDASLIPEMLTEEYLQHNPNVPSGRAAFTKFVTSLPPLKEGKLTTIRDLVMITAERDIVTLAFRNERKHPTKEGVTYTTTWFDMFRIENGKIAEHWDSARLWQ